MYKLIPWTYVSTVVEVGIESRLPILISWSTFDDLYCGLEPFEYNSHMVTP